MKTIILAAALGLAAQTASAGEPPRANALLILPSEKTAFDKGFQALLDKGGAKLLDSYPPSVFMGYIPATLDKSLKEFYGAQVYREKVEDWGAFARYGERAVFAVNVWNKRFVEDPPEAPLVVSSDVRQAGRKKEGLTLEWNAVMKALYYRLQVSQAPDFSRLLLDSRTASNRYVIFPAFWTDGVYYWRVAGVMGLNNGAVKDGAFSETFTFAVSRPGTAGKETLPPPGKPREKEFYRAIVWGPSAQYRYYRLQLSETAEFAPPQMDVFSDTTSYKASGLPVRPGEEYFMRLMGSDGEAYSPWSGTFRITMQSQEPRRPSRRRAGK
jgi:hypothetical protein